MLKEWEEIWVGSIFITLTADLRSNKIFAKWHVWNTKMVRQGNVILVNSNYEEFISQISRSQVN